MKPTLHSLSFSAPCRAVEMVADVLNLDIDRKTVDLMKGEHLSPEYMKISNGHHVVPVLQVSDSFSLFESRAIMGYLVNKHAPGHSLYPQDPEKRALVDQYLYFDACALYSTLSNTVYPVVRGNQKYNPEMGKMLEDKLALLDADLGKSPYVAGHDLTIADLSLLATYSSIKEINKWNTAQYANINNWVKRIKDSGKIKNYDELVVNTAKVYGDWIGSKLNA